MVHQVKYIIALLFIGMITSFQVNNKAINIMSQWMKPRSIASLSSYSYSIKSSSLFSNSIIKHRMNSMIYCEPIINSESSTPWTPSSVGADFAQYAIGQEYQGKLLSAHKFGVFVEIGKNMNVLLPKSLLGVNYRKLCKLAEEKFEEKVRIEIASISVENRTLTGRYIYNYKTRPDLSTLNAKELETKQFVATVVSAHEFGVFAEIDELGVEGLIPISRLPEGSSKDTIKSEYKKGSKVTVRVETINVDEKKLVLSARLHDNRIDITQVIPPGISPERWTQGYVQSVQSYGLFIRPANMDCIGLLHHSRIPRDLIINLKKLAPITSDTNKTDVEALFMVGDVLKFRIHSTDSGKMVLSCLPYTSAADDYVILDDEDVKEFEGKAAGEGDYKKKRRRREDVLGEVIVVDVHAFNGNSVLKWWRGKAYADQLKTLSAPIAVDEDVDFISESRAMREGTWRRLFQIDMEADEADYEATAVEEDLKEIEEEIGELVGLDEDLERDHFGLGVRFDGFHVGASIEHDIPAEWREQIPYFQEQEESNRIRSAILRGGKKLDMLEMESMLREIEVDNERRASSNKRRYSSKRHDSINTPENIPDIIPDVIQAATVEEVEAAFGLEAADDAPVPPTDGI